MTKMHGNPLRFGPETAFDLMKNRFDSTFSLNVDSSQAFLAACSAVP
jgi:hypothetical protein